MEGVIDGIRIVFCIQLLLIGGFLIFNKKDRNYPLAFLCILVGLFFLWRFIMPRSSNIFTVFFVHFNREIIVPPLAYLVLLQINKKLSKKDFFNHLSIPIIFTTSVAVFFTFINTEIRTRFINNVINMSSILIVSIIYFSKGRTMLKQLKKEIIFKAFIKYKAFFYTIVLTYLLMTIISIISYFIQYKLLLQYYGTPDGKHLTNTGNIFIDILGHFFNGPYYIISIILTSPIYILPFFLVIFAISELSIFKSFFLPKDIKYDKRVLTGNSTLEQKLNTFFTVEKQFTNKELTIDLCCEELNCTKKELKDFLKLIKNTTFTNYLNSFRISEFKTLLTQEKNSIYDIHSIAEMAGFKSRATFYRVFKEIEGITPTQFKNKIDS